MLWTSALLSLRVALLATTLVAIIAIPAAALLARRKFRGISLIEGVLTIPLVLPPTVVGYLIIYGLGVNSQLGTWLLHAFGFRLLFTEPGAVLAAATVSFPLMYLPAKAAFAAIDPDLRDLARLAGAHRLEIFWHVSLPLARRGIASGLLLTFARSIGEFGATLMVFGSFPEKQTLPVRIWAFYQGNEAAGAASAVIILAVTSLVAIIVHNRFFRNPAY